MKNNTIWHIPRLFVIGLSTVLLSSSHSVAQSSGKKEGKIHLKITQEIDGKVINIDTVYKADQQDEINDYLKNLGINMSEPSEPPFPPMAPEPPLPPDAPEPPDAPNAPTPPDRVRSEKRIIIRTPDKNMSKEDKADLEKEMEELKKELKDIELTELRGLPDLKEFSKEELKFMSKEEQKQFEKEMEILNEEMKGLEEKIKNIKIEIIEEDTDSKPRSENGHQRSENNFSYSFKDMPGLHLRSCNDSLGRMKVYCFSNKDDDFSESSNSDKKNDVKERKIVKIYKNRRASSETGEEKKKESTDTQTTQADQKNSYELKPQSIEVYPNPGNGMVNIAFQLNEKEPVRIKIIDGSGKLVYDEYLDNFQGFYSSQVDLTEKGKGVYLLTITQKDQWIHKKIIIK